MVAPGYWLLAHAGAKKLDPFFFRANMVTLCGKWGAAVSKSKMGFTFVANMPTHRVAQQAEQPPGLVDRTTDEELEVEEGTYKPTSE